MGLMDWLRARNEDRDFPGHQYGFSVPITGSGPFATDVSVGENADKALTLSAIWRATNLLSGLVGMLPTYVKKRSDDGSWAIDEKNRWYDVVNDEPNPWQDASTFRKLAMTQQLFNGQTFWWKRVAPSGRRRELIALPPSRMHPLRQEANGQVVWQYNAPDGKNYHLTKGIDLIHTVGITLDGVTGVSLLRAMSRATALGLTLEKFSSSHFSRGPMMKGMLSPKSPMGAKTRAAVTKSFTAAFSGEQNWFNIPVLPSEMEWFNVGLSNQDSQFLESKTYTILEFARFTGIPAVLLMHTDKSAVYANAGKFFESFVDFDFAIWVSMLEQGYGRLFKKLERRNTKVQIDTSQLKRGNVEGRFKTYEIGIRSGIWSPNDCLRMEGQPSREGGNVYVDPRLAFQKVSGTEKTSTATTTPPKREEGK